MKLKDILEADEGRRGFLKDVGKAAAGIGLGYLGYKAATHQGSKYSPSWYVYKAFEWNGEKLIERHIVVERFGDNEGSAKQIAQWCNKAWGSGTARPEYFASPRADLANVKM